MAAHLPTRSPARPSQVVAALPQLLRDASPTALARAVAQVPAYRLLPALLTPLEKQCLFRDYSVLVSALLLEGKAKAGKPRARVPANIAVPFCTLAQDLSERAIMSYDSYCLANVFSMADDGGSGAAPPAQQAAMAGSTYGVLVDYEPGVSDAMHWEQLRLVRAFDGGAEECTFVTVHAEIEANTPALLRAYKRVLRGLGAGAVDAVLAGLQRLRDVQEKIVVSQLKMYNASDPRNYVAYVRPWIFGWSGNEDLPDGVVEFERGRLLGLRGREQPALPCPPSPLRIPPARRSSRACPMRQPSCAARRARRAPSCHRSTSFSASRTAPTRCAPTSSTLRSVRGAAA